MSFSCTIFLLNSIASRFYVLVEYLHALYLYLQLSARKNSIMYPEMFSLERLPALRNQVEKTLSRLAYLFSSRRIVKLLLCQLISYADFHTNFNNKCSKRNYYAFNIKYRRFNECFIVSAIRNGGHSIYEIPIKYLLKKYD